MTAGKTSSWGLIANSVAGYAAGGIPEPAAAAGEFNALLIEDDEFVRGTLSRQLQSLGVARLVTAADGMQAMRMLKEGAPFTIVISDLCLPGVDGVELLRLIAEYQPQAALILISAMEHKVLTAAAGVARARGLRVLGHLDKPVTLEHLRVLLQRLETPVPSSTPKPAARASFTVDCDDLRAALDRGEIHVHTQPKLYMGSGRLVGVEMLARWQHARHGFVPPTMFIAVAEEHDLIDRLTDVVLRKSLLACRNWSLNGLETKVSVNFSASALHRLDLPDMIGALLDECGVEPGKLIVEITETATIQHALHALDVLTRLRLRGIGLALDDFGCGYATLQQLKEIPFTELKVDSSFVLAATTDPESRSIVRNCIDLAHQLGLIAVAEGVETRAHWDLVAALGCDVSQGYYIARAFPAEQLPAWYAQRSATLS